MQVKKFTERTIKTSINSTKAFFRYINGEFSVEELEEVTHVHIKQYIHYLQKQGRAEVYINSILKYLRMFYRYCIQEDYILERNNPCLKVKWSREPKTIIKTFTDEEAIKVLK